MRSMLVATVIASGVLLAVGASATPPVRNVAPMFEKPMVLVQGRACRSCRRDCYYDHRTACGYSQSCRSAFTQCMRGCWEDYCR